ncbi:helix-turn-helix domain-containing protein [Streptomyces yaizuensis]|uniref:Scr1 family TA system antitoxin-like transcriptional regulator n=1 Tax=Streptomyces yaizuensis TaxID=2989713 RepID=A0ABQ5PBB8_9ACTN|nr:helix-turn-helix transcriptional regulator [Streptomyces sp. YSPA8]GLF99788.1 Scr1 family TA system antitoxin-like transcriptional regulator [Streptomyces sp. YSPA8]
MTVESESGEPIDSTASPLAYFGSEVKLEREALGMSRIELGKEVACSQWLVAKIETGERVPQLAFAEACDRVFPHSRGRFARLWPLAMRYAFPPWFRRYVELEWTATTVRMFHPLLLPGLVQTREYATAILKEGRPENLEDLITARLERQHILQRERPARLWLVLHERALRNVVGDREVMRKQLGRLRELAETPTHRVQIIPDDGRQQGPMASPFGLLGFSEGADVVHVDGFPRGYVLAEAPDVAEAHDAYDLLKTMAAPLSESAALIDSISKDCYS